jgi:hypothetical protein
VPAETRFARSGDLSIAYQVVGDGPFDVVFVPPTVSHVELGWDVPGMRVLRENISSFARLIHFDKRGTGMSDRVSGAPTLVLHNTYDRWVDVEAGRDLATRIPGAEFVELPIDGHITPAAEMPRVLDVVQRFLQAASEADAEREPDRQLATLLFTDIVDSTAHLAKLGDSGWRGLLERHHGIVRTQLSRARGARWTPPATASSPLSTARHAPSGAPRRSWAG